MQTTAVELLTVAKLSRMLGRSVADIEQAIEADPIVEPKAMANREPVFDRGALAEIIDRLEGNSNA